MPKRTKRLWWEGSDPPTPPVDTPDCFTDNEWASYYEAEKEATWKPKAVPKRVKEDMCADCDLPYQLSQMRLGKCNPYYGAITPIHRRALIAAGEEDPHDKEDASWPELPVLPWESLGLRENGAGDQETAADADHDLVLP